MLALKCWMLVAIASRLRDNAVGLVPEHLLPSFRLGGGLEELDCPYCLFDVVLLGAFMGVRGIKDGLAVLFCIVGSVSTRYKLVASGCLVMTEVLAEGLVLRLLGCWCLAAGGAVVLLDPFEVVVGNCQF